MERDFESDKRFLLEWGSINYGVASAANEVAHLIWDESKRKETKISEVTGVPFINGSFRFNLNKFFGESHNDWGIDEITINYVLYIVDNIKEHNDVFDKLYGDGSANSSADYETKTLTIYSSIIAGYPSPDFLSDVTHELEHMYEYGKGMQKRVSLYDLTVECMKSDNENTVALAQLLYFTFPHEMDAYVHSFYAILSRNDFDGTFEDGLKLFPHYDHIVSLMGLFKSMHRSDANAALIPLGFDYVSFKKRIHFFFKKFKAKLGKVFEKYKFEKAHKINPIGMLEWKSKKRGLILLEYKKRYGDLRFGNEDDFNS